MPIPLSCSCGASLQANDHDAGGIVACPQCQARLEVPLLVELVDETAVSAQQARLFHPRNDPENADFFVPPPEEIGPLRSAHTSLLKTKRHKSFGKRLLIGMGLGLAMAAIPAPFMLNLATGLFITGFCAVITCPVLVGLTFYLTRFRHFCGYVGQHGIAHYSCAGSRERITERKELLFQDAEELLVNETRIVSGLHRGTTYVYTWSSDAGGPEELDGGDSRSPETVFVLKGHHSSNYRDVSLCKYEFTQAAEEGWSRHLWGKVLPCIQAGKTWTFRYRRGEHICCKEDGLELLRGGNVTSLSREDLAEVRVEMGVIRLKERGAKEGWFTSTGVHSFFYSDLANARVFLALLNRFYEVPTGSSFLGFLDRLL